MADERWIRELYEEQRERSAAHPIDDATWERLACGELSAEQRAAAFDHITRCAECTRVYRGLAALEAEAVAAGLDVPRSAPRATPRFGFAAPWWAFGGLAAAAAVVLALLVPRTPPTANDGETFRSAPVAGGPVALAPLGRIARPPSEFRWQPAAAKDVVYRVEVSDADGALAWSSEETPGISTAWPPPARALRPGIYYWRVIARPTTEAAGVEATQASPLVSFELLRP